ncbi:hypothetical protein INT48_009332 [Thamnidium elegans]|uniref:Mitochondrial distribution and morphology protein 34 n=1 Tax=Thamnidium elegans TaxID=101142 RepID=A0A8H7VRR9_9FUNG|nr:hypothetical protein INT48_009332 [Thamnidium elegans]
MAFRFSWPEFDQEFYVEAKSQLETALNKGNKPPVIVDHITPPELEILEIGELGTDKFRGIFKLNYAGDAYIEVQTKVQANPMHAKSSELPRHSRPGILAADQPLVVPMILRISDLKLRGIVVLVVSKTKGVTLVFKNDPLESIRISSTFDSISILRDFLQRQIENQLRNMLQEDLPVMIHTLSLRIIESEQEKKKKQEQEERLIQQQKRQLSIYSQSTRSNSIRSSSWVHHQGSEYSLPELDNFPISPTNSQTSTLFTPTFDMYYDQYLTTSPTSTVFGSSFLELDDLKKNDLIHNNNNNDVDDYFHCRSVPITAANLFTHNRSMNQLGLSSYKEYHPINHLMYQPTKSQQDLISENGLSVATTPCLSMADIYADDADAPWYAVEGPELFSTAPPVLPFDMPMNETNITLNPSQNRLAAKLSTLTSINYTLSPLTESISNFTFRSLPYVKKSSTSSPRHKKVPKRRITRLNMAIPRL